jgi:hypothetical protein
MKIKNYVGNLIFNIQINLHDKLTATAMGRKLHELLPKKLYEITYFYWAGESGVDEKTYIKKLSLLEYWDLHNDSSIQQVDKL